MMAILVIIIANLLGKRRLRMIPDKSVCCKAKEAMRLLCFE